jgi:hypothetical protein
MARQYQLESFQDRPRCVAPGQPAQTLFELREVGFFNRLPIRDQPGGRFGHGVRESGKIFGQPRQSESRSRVELRRGRCTVPDLFFERCLGFIDALVQAGDSSASSSRRFGA